MNESGHKTKQADYYDHSVDVEFETNRPRGESRLYQYLMDYKFRRVVDLLSSPLAGARVLDICCGSGMDAEYLARAGAIVVALDISPGAIARSEVRRNRSGVAYEALVGDAEHLPFPDNSFEYAFVHDGLHHLVDPTIAIAEMARVARVGLIITEPADAALTKLLIRLGIMQPHEEAGNLVVRFGPSTLSGVLAGLGFDRISYSRYLMKYGHPPARWWRWFDAPPLLALARSLFLGLGVVAFGRWGNKLAVVAERSNPASPAATGV
jgi:SAM-dependent methyltransferase